jgi:hypothetical protein
MPHFLMEEIRKLNQEERNSLFAELATRLITPISRIHLIKLFAEHLDQDEKRHQLIGSFFSKDANDEIRAFLQLVAWLVDDLDHQPGTENWSIATRLLFAWGHSNQIFEIFIRSSVPFDWLVKIFRERRSSLPLRYLFLPQPAVWNDIAYGGNFDWPSFKILGLNYSLKGHEQLSLELTDSLLAEIFHSSDTLKDRDIFDDRLSSFLGGELGGALQNLLSKEDDRLPVLKTSALREMATSAIDWISDADLSTAGWQTLLAIYQNQQLPDDLLKLFDKALSEFDFDALVRKNNVLGFMSYFFATCQAKGLSSDNQNYLIKQIGQLAEVASTLDYEIQDPSKSMRKDEIAALLIDGSIRLSKIQADERIYDAFSDMVLEIVNHWKGARGLTLRLLNRLLREVPKAQKLGKLLLRLRSE